MTKEGHGEVGDDCVVNSLRVSIQKSMNSSSIEAVTSTVTTRLRSRFGSLVGGADDWAVDGSNRPNSSETLTSPTEKPVLAKSFHDGVTILFWSRLDERCETDLLGKVVILGDPAVGESSEREERGPLVTRRRGDVGRSSEMRVGGRANNFDESPSSPRTRVTSSSSTS